MCKRWARIVCPCWCEIDHTCAQKLCDSRQTHKRAPYLANSVSTQTKSRFFSPLIESSFPCVPLLHASICIGAYDRTHLRAHSCVTRKRSFAHPHTHAGGSLVIWQHASIAAPYKWKRGFYTASSPRPSCHPCGYFQVNCCPLHIMNSHKSPQIAPHNCPLQNCLYAAVCVFCICTCVTYWQLTVRAWLKQCTNPPTGAALFAHRLWQQGRRILALSIWRLPKQIAIFCSLALILGVEEEFFSRNVTQREKMLARLFTSFVIVHCSCFQSLLLSTVSWWLWRYHHIIAHQQWWLSNSTVLQFHLCSLYCVVFFWAHKLLTGGFVDDA